MKLSLNGLDGYGRVQFLAHVVDVLDVPGDTERHPGDRGRSLTAAVSLSMDRREWERIGRPVDFEVDL